MSKVDKTPCQALRCDCHTPAKATTIGQYDHCECGHTMAAHFTPSEKNTRRRR